MDLKTLRDACDRLLEQGVPEDEPVALEADGKCYEITALAVSAASDLWEPNTVLLSAQEIDDS